MGAAHTRPGTHQLGQVEPRGVFAVLHVVPVLLDRPERVPAKPVKFERVLKPVLVRDDEDVCEIQEGVGRKNNNKKRGRWLDVCEIQEGVGRKIIIRKRGGG